MCSWLSHFGAASSWETSPSENQKPHGDVFYLELCTLTAAICWAQHQDLLTGTSGGCCATRCDRFMAVLSFRGPQKEMTAKPCSEELFGGRRVGIQAAEVNCSRGTALNWQLTLASLYMLRNQLWVKRVRPPSNASWSKGTKGVIGLLSPAEN